MRIDWYTKGVLTVIAVLLGVIAIRPYINPDAVAHAQGSFAGVQYVSSVGGRDVLFDSRTGDVWDYSGTEIYHARVTKLGAPFVAVK